MKARPEHAARLTVDHDVIRRWAEERKGKPVTVISSGRDNSPGMMWIYFPGSSSDKTFEETTWTEFFEMFELTNLALLYQEETEEGELSYFCQFVSRPGSERQE